LFQNLKPYYRQAFVARILGFGGLQQPGADMACTPDNFAKIKLVGKYKVRSEYK
jgi:hypothetical protein